MKMLKKESVPVIESRKTHFAVPAVVLAVALIFIIIHAAMGNGMFNYGVEFVGGTSIRVDFRQAISIDDVSAIVQDITGQNPRIQTVDNDQTLQIRLLSIDAETRIALIAALAESYPQIDHAGIEIVDVSATVSGEMQRTAVIAVAVALAAMFIYIAFRFRDTKIGLSTIISLLVNTLALVGFYAIARVPLNESFIVVILTILGYSVNNTIIIFDRLRENRKLLPRATHAELVNQSVAQSLTRTVYTTLTTSLVVLCLLIFGVSSIRQFAAPILFGILFGTYMSLCFSGSVLYALSTRAKKA